MIIDNKDNEIFKIIRELKNEGRPNCQKLESILKYQKLKDIQGDSLERCGIELNPIVIIYNQQEGNYEVYKIKVRQNDEKQEIDYRPKMYN